MTDKLKKIVGAIDGNDILALIGLCMLFAGLWQVYEPLAPIVLGAVLTRIAIWGG